MLRELSVASGGPSLPLKHFGGNWVVVSDNLFFAEGKGGGLRPSLRQQCLNHRVFVQLGKQAGGRYRQVNAG